MHRSVYVGLVLVPLLIGLGSLIFAIGTEYWTRLDYSKINKININSNLTILKDNRQFQRKKIKFEFPKYTSLFGECDEFKLVDILVPVTSVESSNLESNKPENIQNKMFEYDNDGCVSRQKCNELNEAEKGSCFCCDLNNNLETTDNCCFHKSKLCDGVANCKDKSDELDTCPIRKLYFSSRYFDNKHNCLRHQYNLINFAKNVLNRNFSSANDTFSDFCLKKLVKSNSYSVKIFTFRILTLLSLTACILFTILCITSLLFVTCCYNLDDKRKLSLNHANEFSYALASEEDYETNSLRSSRSKCCRCNCLLCPFVFYTFFSFFAFATCLLGLGGYLLTLFYMRNAYLIYDYEFVPEYITQAYQYNSWLFDMQQFGISFYAFLLSFGMYLLSFVMSTCISCRIQMSPAWKNRHTNSYEVLQMQDIVMNNANGKGKYGKSTSGQYKKVTKDNKNSEKEAKKIGKKYKKKAKNEEGYSLSEESHELANTPKTRLNAMDDSYE